MQAVTRTVHLKSTVITATVVVVANACMAQTAWDTPAQTTMTVDFGKNVAMERALITTRALATMLAPLSV